jgi:chromosome segregation ATPase
VEATEKVKSEFQQRLEEEKKKSGDIAKAYEDLQKEAQKQEALTREGEEWRSRAVALGEKVRELETNLIEKTSALEQLNHQKDEILNQSEKAAEESQQELTTLRRREQEFSRKIEGLEQSLQEMTGSLRSRDGALAQFEKQISELAEKAQGYESIRQEYDAKLSEQEVRLAKAEDDHRRYRSRTDRKNAAATRELGEWIRNVDTLRQNLQKLILFLGSDSAVLDSEKKSPAKSPLTRGPDSANKGKS